MGTYQVVCFGCNNIFTSPIPAGPTYCSICHNARQTARHQDRVAEINRRPSEPSDFQFWQIYIIAAVLSIALWVVGIVSGSALVQMMGAWCMKIAFLPFVLMLAAIFGGLTLNINLAIEFITGYFNL